MSATSRAPAGVIPIMALHVAFGVCYFLTAQEVLNMKLVAPSAQPLTGMIYCADAVSSFVSYARERRVRATMGTPTSSSTSRAGFPRVALALPVFDLCGLTCAFEAMRALGGPLYQTLSGLLIPFSALLSSVFLSRTFTSRQITAIAIVLGGLAVKAGDALTSDATVDARGVVIAIAATVFYGFRGLTMEYLSKSATPLSGNAQTMLMGCSGLAAFAAYTMSRTARDVDGLVWAYYNARERDTREVAKVLFGNMLSRAFMVKMMMAIVTRAGATQLALSNAIRSVGVITFSHVFFCANDSRQCLNAQGALSAAMVVIGGVAYALGGAKSTSSSSSSASSSLSKSRSKSTAAKPSTKITPAPSLRRRSARRS
uniref:Sugar phosphate transporter domain-containing protein n=1 Tax=Ostreococcus mediterraneus TaxID=1486918 RepID=A0A7S0PQ67_9CHLO|mmetsp:Transcript_8928/g.33120  ORF Transcript_8928/g.33120 Transcript_8928/m.33120 type:complete len:371 (+) Transcript_8928:40-1152(+)